MDITIDDLSNYDYENTERIEMTEEMYLALKEYEDEVAAGRCEFYDAKEVMKEICKLYS